MVIKQQLWWQVGVGGPPGEMQQAFTGCSVGRDREERKTVKNLSHGEG